MIDLRAWRRQHNLEEYAKTFAANDVDLDILAELTDRDLAELGVSLGNRRRLLEGDRRARGGFLPRRRSPGAERIAIPAEVARRQGAVIFERRAEASLAAVAQA